jgi:hypothetical protein
MAETKGHDMGRKPIGAQPMTPNERQQRRRAKVQRERQDRAEAEARRQAQRHDREYRALLLEQAKAEAGGEFINFRDDSAPRIATVIMRNLRTTHKARELLEELARLLATREDDEQVRQRRTAPPRRPEPRSAPLPQTPPEPYTRRLGLGPSDRLHALLGLPWPAIKPVSRR